MGAKQDFDNPNLFTENAPGEYTYTSSEYGTGAKGQLQKTDSPVRDNYAQRTAGGEDRRGKDNPYGVDDGGHYIGARYGGAPGKENLTAQDRNLNRGAYKHMEDEWDNKLSDGEKVYVNVEGFNGTGGQRPTNYMGYVITETEGPNGEKNREIDYISFNNESAKEQDKWVQAEEEFYRDNPEVVEEQMAQNTTMEYIWNEDLQDVEPNPYYVAETTEQTQETENIYAVDPGQTAGEEESAGTDYDIGGGMAGADDGRSADNGADNGNDQGMD